MNTNRFFWITPLLLILLIFLSVFLYLRFQKASIPVSTLPREEARVTEVVSFPGDPIVKMTISGDKGVIYELKGSFARKLQSGGGLLSGIFQVQGDPLERKIRVFVGGTDEYTFFGTYEGSFEGSSTWKRTPSSLVAETVEPGEVVIIRPTFEFTGIKGEEDGPRQVEQVLDVLIEEFHTRKYELQIPIGFALTTVHLGVVR